MAIAIYQATLSGATQITADNVPVMEIHLNPAAHDYYFGLSDVSTTKYFTKVLATATAPTVVGQGPDGFAIDNLRNLFIVGTDADVVNVGVIAL